MSETESFFQTVHDRLTTQQDVAVATIVRTRGSSPREVGARMLVGPDGATDGTVGGGCGEADVWRAALDVLSDAKPRMVTVDLTNAIGLDTDGVCGGTMEIFVDAWRADDRLSAQWTRELLRAVHTRSAALALSVVGRSRGAPVALGSKLLVVDGEKCLGGFHWPTLEQRVMLDVPAVVAERHSQVRSYTFGVDGDSDGVSEREQVSVFFDLALPKPTLIVVGAGHVAQPTSQVGKLLDFEVIVVDDRPAFANRERFPWADRIIVDDFETALDSLPITPSTYVVLVTRGHAHDVRVLRRIVEQPAAYIGMIGSRRRVFAVYKLLHDEGVPIETLLKVHAPIGLDIKTETPGEIAVSIGAEILKTYRGGGATSVSEHMRDQYLYSLRRGDLVTA